MLTAYGYLVSQGQCPYDLFGRAACPGKVRTSPLVEELYWKQSALVSASRESSAQDEGLFPHVRWLEGVAGVCLCMKPRSGCGELSRFVTGERTPSLRNLESINCPYASESTRPRLNGPDNVRRENSWAKLPCCLSRGPSRAVRVLTLRL